LIFRPTSGSLTNNTAELQMDVDGVVVALC
jgi:hypothetical protein